jgi:hypothetical protein
MAAVVHPEFRFYGSASMGVCYLCNMSRRPDDVVVDLGVEIDTPNGMGSLQFCSSCVKHLGRLVGMVSDDEADRLRADLALTLSDLGEVAERAEAAEEALAALRRVDALKSKSQPLHQAIQSAPDA